jgi:alkanesulfonate monooxygenase SsuD/methylene tetrahydromethanopterin reductase-like flavin-dependent oxidoreductase (luciferase family)
MEIGVVNLGDNLPDPTSGNLITDAEKHRRLVAQAIAAEAAGFSVFQVGEHHFNHYTISSPVVALAAVAQHTSTIRLGSGVTLLPTRDPVLVAEEFSTLDALSGGRAEIGVGRGVFEGIFRAMGRPAEQAGEILEEMVGLLQRLLTEEEVTWEGTWRGPLDAVTIRPRSIQRPIPLWSGSTSGLVQAARLGLPCMWVSVLYPFEQLADTAARYRQAWLAAGRSEESFQLGIGVHYHVAPTSQLARRRFAPHYTRYLEAATTIEPSRLRRAVRSSRPDPSLLETVPIFGSPSEVVDKLSAARELLGLTRVVLAIDLGGMPQELVLEQLELTGREVIPALSSSPGSQPPAVSPTRASRR